MAFFSCLETAKSVPLGGCPVGVRVVEIRRIPWAPGTPGCVSEAATGPPSRVQGSKVLNSTAKIHLSELPLHLLRQSVSFHSYWR